MRRNRVKSGSFVLGLLIMAAGILMLAFNAGLIPLEYRRAVFSWPALLVAIGFVLSFSRGKWPAGTILMMIGGFFLLPKLNIERGFVAQNGWAIALIAVGILIMCNTVRRRSFFYCARGEFSEEMEQKHRKRREKCRSHKWKNLKKNEPGYIDRNCVFGGRREKLDINNFKGGEINSIFGGIELDLADAQLAEGVNCLELSSVFGGIILYVPIEWNIEIHQDQVFGQFVDNRPKPGFEVDENRILIIEANAVFGGGEIRCRAK